jgi:Carboxypeptidase regulatory-like domain
MILPDCFARAVRTIVGCGVLCGLTISTAAFAQAPRVGSGASLSGIVFDSLAGKPLADAQVQLVNADSLSAAARNATSDSLGRFSFATLPPGRYLLGFIHPVLDSIGVEAKPREVMVNATSVLRVDLAIPSARALRIGICGAAAVADSDALILGIVRRASDRVAVDSAVVTALWVEFVLERGRMTRSMARRAVTTQESGWFAICGAPSGGTISLATARGSDSTDALELEVPAAGFVRRDLYFGSARIALGDTSAKPADSLSLSRAPRLTGDGRLTGVVVASVGGRPLAGARVGILNGPQTRADDNGAWTLAGLPTGTRTLEVRAIAHYPVSMPVDVIEGAAPIRVALLTLKSVLDTVRVTASRGGSGKLLEFMQRKKSSGSGRFITSEDIASRNPIYTTDLFRSMPGIYLARDQNGDEILVQRSNTFSSPTCRVSVYMNGMSLRNMSANDINGYVRPNDVIGIEVYTAAGAPPQFSEQNGCGSVVIWSR